MKKAPPGSPEDKDYLLMKDEAYREFGDGEAIFVRAKVNSDDEEEIRRLKKVLPEGSVIMTQADEDGNVTVVPMGNKTVSFKKR